VRRAGLATARHLALESSQSFESVESFVSVITPANLPQSLQAQWNLVATRLPELPQGLFTDLPIAAQTVGRVVVCSDFVLAMLLRQPDALLDRLADEEPLTTPDVEARFALAGCDEAQAMSKFRRARQVEMVRIAWRDLSGFSDLETNLLDLSVLADSAIHAALDFAVGALAPRYGKPVDDSGVFLPLPIDSGSCR